MRRTMQEQQILRNEDDQTLMGLLLGYDYCAEHEWGIKGLERTFGIPGVSPDLVGLPARTITKVPPEYLIRTDKKAKTITLAPVRTWNDDVPLVNREYVAERELGQIYGNDPFAAAWNEKQFGVRMRLADSEILTQIHTALQNCDLAIFRMAKSGPFGGSGLALVIPSRVPDVHLKTMADGDLDQLALKAAVEATGILQRLKEAGCEYFACSPRWADNTKTEINFWLNPMGQDRHNYGWMTVADLDDWIQGKGKVVKQTAAR